MSTPDLIKQLTHQLAHCLNQDRHVLKRQLDRCRSKNSVEELNALASRIERSVVARNKRLASIPVLTFPDLPVTGKKRRYRQTDTGKSGGDRLRRNWFR